MKITGQTKEGKLARLEDRAGGKEKKSHMGKGGGVHPSPNDSDRLGKKMLKRGEILSRRSSLESSGCSPPIAMAKKRGGS